MEVRGHQKVCRSLEFSTLYIIVSRFSEIRGQLVLQMLTNQQTVLKRTPSLESQYYSTPLVVCNIFEQPKLALYYIQSIHILKGIQSFTCCSSKKYS